MYRIILIAVNFIIAFTVVDAQIVIAPEVGLYHRPYFLAGLSNDIEQKKLDYYVGLMGEVRLMPKLFGQTRVSYIFRHQTDAAMEFTHLPDFKDGLYTNKEMTFNVDLLYEPIKNSKIGLGLGMIHKLSSQVEENFYYKSSRISYFDPNILYNASLVVNHNWGRLGLNVRCFIVFRHENLDSTYMKLVYDRPYGLTMGINYRLFGHKKEK